MFSARRVYVYLVSLISLGAVTFAAISLLQKLIAPGPSSRGSDISLQIAILIIVRPGCAVQVAVDEASLMSNVTEGLPTVIPVQ